MEIIGLIVLSLLGDLIWGGVSYAAGRGLLELARPWRRKRGALQPVRPIGSAEHVVSAGSDPTQQEQSGNPQEEASNPFFVWLLGTIFLLALLGGICLLARWL